MKNVLPLVAVGLLVVVCPTKATLVLPPTLDELVASAESVVHGTVASVRSEWRGSGESRRIVTLVKISVSETVMGNPVPDLELEFLGGTVGQDRLVVAGQPEFKAGDEDILFVASNGRTICPVVAMTYGRFLVAHDADGRAFIARDNGVPLTSTDEVAQPLTAERPATILSRIESGLMLTPDQFTAAVRESAQRQGKLKIRQP